MTKETAYALSFWIFASGISFLVSAVGLGCMERLIRYPEVAKNFRRASLALYVIGAILFVGGVAFGIWFKAIFPVVG